MRACNSLLISGTVIFFNIIILLIIPPVISDNYHLSHAAMKQYEETDKENTAIRVEVEGSGDTAEITLTTSQPIKNAIGYLVFWDMDTNSLMSYSFYDNRWKEGLSPVRSEPFRVIDLSAPAVIASSYPECPEEDRCFIGAGILPEGAPDMIISIYPLTMRASFERLKGQWLFRSPQDEGNIEIMPLAIREDVAYEADTGVEEEAIVGAKAENAAVEDAGDEAVTEKPDLYLVDEDVFLYANRDASLLIAVDMSEPSSPYVLDKHYLSDYPKEIYRIGGFYVALSGNSSKTTVTALNLSGGRFIVQDRLTLDGSFLESRRINRRIFIASVSNAYEYEPYYVLEAAEGVDVDMASNETLTGEKGDSTDAIKETHHIYSIQVNEDGSLSLIDDMPLTLSPRDIAIFPNCLVTIANSPTDYNSDIITAYRVHAEGEDAIEKALSVSINGTVPSDLHVYCGSAGIEGTDVLAFMASPHWRQRDAGSALYIYGLDEKKEIGRISGIAPEEALYGTVFSGNRAYVVTFERIDPLWVIDIEDPYHPEIIGELKAPGWSEKLFFNDNKLLSIGYINGSDLNEAEEAPERIGRLISVSLFDVTVPEEPALISRIVPFKKTAYNSYSEAVYDERAFYLDWSEGKIAFPLNTWAEGSQDWLQAIGIIADGVKSAGNGSEITGLTDLGHLELPFSARRTFWIEDTDYLGAFSTTDFMTARYIEGSGIKPLSTIALIMPVDMLYYNQGEGPLAFGISRNYGRQHIYIIDTSLIGEGRNVDIDRAMLNDFALKNDYYGQILYNGKDAIALYKNLSYSYYSSKRQFELTLYTINGEVKGPFTVKDNILSSKDCWTMTPIFRGRTFIIPESCQEQYNYHPVILEDREDASENASEKSPEKGYYYDLPSSFSYNILIADISNAQSDGHLSFSGPISVPGMPVDLTEEGDYVITQEPFEEDGLRINVLTVSHINSAPMARLLNSITIKNCPEWGGSSVKMVKDGKIYLECRYRDYYYYGIKSERNGEERLTALYVMPIMSNSEGDRERLIFNKDPDNGYDSYDIVKIYPEEKVALVSASNSYPFYEDVYLGRPLEEPVSTAVSYDGDLKTSIMPVMPYKEPECILFDISTPPSLIPIKTVDSSMCYSPDSVIIQEDYILFADGLKGIEKIRIR